MYELLSSIVVAWGISAFVGSICTIGLLIYHDAWTLSVFEERYSLCDYLCYYHLLIFAPATWLICKLVAHRARKDKERRREEIELDEIPGNVGRRKQ